MEIKYLSEIKHDENHCFESNSLTVSFFGVFDSPLETGTTAAKTIALLYAKHNIGLLNEIAGVFNIIIEDKIKKQKFIVNDCLSQMGLYYYQTAKTLYVSYLPEYLFPYAGTQLNHWKIKQHFALQPQLKAESFFQNIEQLQMGHYLMVEDKITVVKYYDLDPRNKVKNLSLAASQDRYEQLLMHSIKRQTMGLDKVGVMMSGGLDSTLVTVLAKKQGLDVFTFSYVFPSIPEANESIWVEAMSKISNQGHTFNGEKYWSLKPPWFVSKNAPVSNPYRHLKDVVYSAANKKNLKVLLTGVFADHLYTSYQYWFNDLIKSNPIKALNELYSQSKSHGFRLFLKSWYRLFVPVTPKYQWLNKKLRVQMKDAYPRLANKSRNLQHLLLNKSTVTAESAPLELEYSLKHNIQLRHPYRDKNMLEFALQTPAWIMGDPSNKKKLARQLAEKYLPASIYQRRKTTTLSSFMQTGILQRELETSKAILADSASDWFDFVDVNIVKRMLKNPNDNHSEKDLFVLWLCLSYENWKQAL
ncbi:MAG: asparagine synthase-related protein [Proteobacteria bacterium]|nr:asparagine synthase-related protein [Pseudomonadota bacterium]